MCNFMLKIQLQISMQWKHVATKAESLKFVNKSNTQNREKTSNKRFAHYRRSRTKLYCSKSIRLRLVRSQSTMFFSCLVSQAFWRRNYYSFPRGASLVTFRNQVLQQIIFHYFYYCVFTLSAISPYITGLKALFNPSNCSSNCHSPN